MLKVVEKPKPAPELWEQVLLTRELEPFYDWMGIPELGVLGFLFPAFLIWVGFMIVKTIRKKVNKNSNVGFHDKGC